MRKPLLKALILFSLILTVFTACDHNVYMGEPERITPSLWKVNNTYFDSLQEAMDYIYGNTKGNSKSKSITDIPLSRTAILQRDVLHSNGETGGGLIVPADFTGGLYIDLNGFTYEFDNSLDHFFKILGGDEVYIQNGTTVIYNEADHKPYAYDVDSKTVHIDASVMDDRRVDPNDSTKSDSKLYNAGPRGQIEVTNAVSTTDEDGNETALTGAVSVVTDGTSGGLIIIKDSRIVLSNIYTRYENADGSISESIPDTTVIPADARGEVRQIGGHVSVEDINKVTDFLDGSTLYPKAILTSIKISDGTTQIDTPHDNTSVHEAVEYMKVHNESHPDVNSYPTGYEVWGSNVTHDFIHIFDDNWTVTLEPTCETAGSKYRLCTVSDCHAGEGGDPYKQTMEIPALGHNYSPEWTYDATYHWHVCLNDAEHKGDTAVHTYSDWVYDENFNGTRYCTVCGRVDSEDHVHAIVHVEAKAPTCTEEGNTEYWKCIVCDKLFANAEGTVPATAESVVIEATGHNWSTDWTHDETDHWHVCLNGCGSTTGTAVHTFSEWTYSSVDGKDHRECTCGRSEERTHVHVLIEHAAVPATCENKGNSAYWECSKCNRYYSDADGTEEITLASTVRDALGHDYSTSWTYDDENHWHTCSHDSSHKTDTGVHTYPDTWTYDSELQANVKTCTVCGKKIIENHDTHTSDTWVTTDPDQHYKVCTVCNTHFDHEDHIFSDWSYDSDLNKDKRTCSVCGRVETRTHVHGTTANNTLTHTAAVSATCTANGNKEYWYCTLCGRYYLDENCTIETTLEGTVTEKFGHHISEHKSYKAATCTEDGNIEYWYCDRCQTYFSDSSYTTEVSQAQTVIEALGHLPSTITKDSYEFDITDHWVVCERDPEHYVVSKENHSWGPIELCDDGHHQIRRCTVCNASKNVDEQDYIYNVGIFAITLPTFIPNAPCGDMIVSHEGDVYTVKYRLHVDAERPTGVVCRYFHNGKYSDFLEPVSVTEDEWTYSFTVKGVLSYRIQVQSYNSGGTITMEEIVNI